MCCHAENRTVDAGAAGTVIAISGAGTPPGSPFMLPFLSFFDDFDEPPPNTRERAQMATPAPSRGKGPQRLLVLGVGILVLLVAGYFLVQRCQRDREVSEYQGYVAKTNEVAKGSAAVGAEFSQALLTSGQTPAKLNEALSRQIEVQTQLTRNAEAIGAPESMRPYDPFLVQSMQYRVSGLRGFQAALEGAFAAAGTSGQVPLEQAASVAATFQRLIASDVVYTDSFQDPAKRVLADRSINAAVDNSQFVDPKLVEFAAPQRMQSILDAHLAGSALPEGGEGVPDANGQLRGTSLIGTRFAPGDVRLDPTITNEVDSANNMALTVTVQNSGDVTEVSIKINVTLRAQGMDDRTLPTAEITTLDPGAEATVEIPFGLSDIVFDDIVTAKVTVEAVPGEQNLDNNVGIYKIQFRLQPA